MNDPLDVFSWGYYTIRIAIRRWHLSVRWRCSIGILNAQLRYADKAIVFFRQNLADSLKTCDPPVRPLIERYLLLGDQLSNSQSCNVAGLNAERDEVVAKIEDYYNGDLPDCFYSEYRAGLSARIVDGLYRYALPMIDRNMPWDSSPK